MSSYYDEFANTELNKQEYLDHFRIAALWGIYDAKVEVYEQKILQAAIDGELKAVIEQRERTEQTDDGFIEIKDPNRIRKIHNGRLGKEYVWAIVSRDNFKNWLQRTEHWPLAEGCLLAKWFDVADKPKQCKKIKTRITNLKRAVLAAIEYFKRKPSMNELWQFFEKNMYAYRFIADITDDKVVWTDTKGNVHDTKKASVANLLSRINYP
jgi:hypothetical protein